MVQDCSTRFYSAEMGWEGSRLNWGMRHRRWDQVAHDRAIDGEVANDRGTNDRSTNDRATNLNAKYILKI